MPMVRARWGPPAKRHSATMGPLDICRIGSIPVLRLLGASAWLSSNSIRTSVALVEVFRGGATCTSPAHGSLALNVSEFLADLFPELASHSARFTQMFVLVSRQDSIENNAADSMLTCAWQTEVDSIPELTPKPSIGIPGVAPGQ